MADDAGRRRRFGFWLLGLWVAAFVVSAVATTPDPFSQVITLVPLLLVGVLVAYVAVYRLGWSLPGAASKLRRLSHNA